ncbi:Clavaminate synthase-like protein [Auricularia subglabra TFB-10046 SS5]|uniref:Clavaminate synthase-like protein n=1 Tax=Auricularia subglabra (strain TFB-10046 / SS5) TaxID=717982 RepID=J0WUT2_AURST|nr:Clavaminate synthase-like protein [Auricularia subglabra TFB-10046 SS5]
MLGVRRHLMTFEGIGTFPFRWLRDACQCPSCIHPSTRQKLHASSEISPSMRPEQLEKLGDKLKIQWPGHEHPSVYDRAFLEACTASHPAADPYLERRRWAVRGIRNDPSLFIEYTALLDDDRARLLAFEHLARTGLLFVTGVPTERTGNTECELRTLASAFSEIRETFYGQTWDVVARRGSTNIAYTSLFLGLHMDLMYFEHPPRLQFLHCLRNRVEGGTSLFVDALSAAETLRATNPPAFDILTQTRIQFHYQNDGHYLHRTHRTIELDPGTGAVGHINYSPPFQAPFPPETPDAVYDALKAFAEIIEEDGRVLKYLLREGDAVVFDNRRVLHAREAFEDPAETTVGVGQPSRWLKGCYVEQDTMLDRARVLRTRLTEAGIV